MDRQFDIPKYGGGYTNIFEALPDELKSKVANHSVRMAGSPQEAWNQQKFAFGTSVKTSDKPNPLYTFDNINRDTGKENDEKFDALVACLGTANVVADYMNHAQKIIPRLTFVGLRTLMTSTTLGGFSTLNSGLLMHNFARFFAALINCMPKMMIWMDNFNAGKYVFAWNAYKTNTASGYWINILVDVERFTVKIQIEDKRILKKHVHNGFLMASLSFTDEARVTAAKDVLDAYKAREGWQQRPVGERGAFIKSVIEIIFQEPAVGTALAIHRTPRQAQINGVPLNFDRMMGPSNADANVSDFCVALANFLIIAQLPYRLTPNYKMSEIENDPESDTTTTAKINRGSFLLPVMRSYNRHLGDTVTITDHDKDISEEKKIARVANPRGLTLAGEYTVTEPFMHDYPAGSEVHVHRISKVFLASFTDRTLVSRK